MKIILSYLNMKDMKNECKKMKLKKWIVQKILTS